MGRKLVRDFVPGIRLAGEGPINGVIRVAKDPRERRLLGAEKVVEEANELLKAVKAQLAESHMGIPPASVDVRRELGDVLAALQYTAVICNVNVTAAAEAKATSHGGFTKHFVWEWPDDEQPCTIEKDGQKHDLQNSDCPWNCHGDAKGIMECTCPKGDT